MVQAVQPPSSTQAPEAGTAVEPAAASPGAAAVAASDQPGATRFAARLDVLTPLLPAALVLFFSFQAGGYFPDSTGVAAGVLAIVLALRVTLARRPFAALTGPAMLAAGALAGYAAWVLLSASWSEAPGRALVEFDRALLYLLAFVLASTFAFGARRLAWSLRAVVVAIYVVCAAGWATRVAPDRFEAGVSAVPERLSDPLTYWNAQGLIAALGIILAVHLACGRERKWWNAAGAAAVPLLASTLYFTFSRGALLAVAAGLVAYVVLLRSRGLLFGGLAVLPPAAMAVLVSYDADLLASDAYDSPAAVAQGEDVALGVALCTAGGWMLRLAVSRWLEGRVDRVALPARARRPVRLGALAAAAVLLVAVPVAAGAPAALERQVDRFLEGTESNSTSTDDQRTRFLNPANNGRLDHWRVAVEAWREAPLRGTGAGTFQLEWYQRRDMDLNVSDAHSLYLDVLSDLGLVGLALLGLGLLAVAGGVVRRTARRWDPASDRSLHAGLAAAMVAWGVHAGLDWMWELPAVTAWLFALGGFAIAGRVGEGGKPFPGRNVRVVAALGLLVLAVVPFQMVRSQRALEDGLRAFAERPRDCAAVIDHSLRSLASVGSRPEPWELIAYCDVGEGELGLAVQAARNAVARDPENWVYHYALALVRGAAGQDPRPAARRALELNPRGLLAREAVRAFGKARRSRWPVVARRLKLPSG